MSDEMCPYGNMPREAGAGHWREWHRGHGCHLDPDVTRAASSRDSTTRRPAMKFRPTTAATVSDDLSRFSTYLADPDAPGELLDEIAAWLNKKLDSLLNEDAFGTEGQCDPRGDHRG